VGLLLEAVQGERNEMGSSGDRVFVRRVVGCGN